MDNIKIPSNNNFDQKTAKYLLTKCSTLIVENFPYGSEFGIDLCINYTGKNFLGIKMIPPGIHFIHFSLVNLKTKCVAPRIGFFHCFKSGELYCTRWNDQMEDIDLNIHTDEQKQRFYENFINGYLDNQLAPYQFNLYQTWVSLTDFITENLLQKMNPDCGKIYSAINLIYKNIDDQRKQIDENGLPDMIISPENQIKFLSKSLLLSTGKHFIVPANSTPNEITKHSIDSSYTLECLINNNNNQYNVLAELQFSFIIFLFGHQFNESFEYWQKLLRILCNCRQALMDRTEFFFSFIRVLYFQLKQMDDETAILTDIIDGQNLLYNNLQTFFLNIKQLEQISDNENLIERSKKFQKFLSKNFKWNFCCKKTNNSIDIDIEEDVPEDEKPVIVTL